MVLSFCSMSPSCGFSSCLTTLALANTSLRNARFLQHWLDAPISHSSASISQELPVGHFHAHQHYQELCAWICVGIALVPNGIHRISSL